MLIVTDHRLLDTQPGEQTARAACIFSCDEVDLLQDPDCTLGDVLYVTQRCSYNIEDSRLCSHRQAQLPAASCVRFGLRLRQRRRFPEPFPLALPFFAGEVDEGDSGLGRSFETSALLATRGVSFR